MKFGKFLKNIIPKTLKERIKTEVLYLQNRKFLLETKRHYKKVLDDVRKKEKYSFGVYVVFDSTFGAYELVDLLKKDTRFSVKIVIIPDVSRGKNHMKHQYLETKNFFINKYGKDLILDGYNLETDDFIDNSKQFDFIYLANPYDSMVNEVHGIKYLSRCNLLPLHINYCFQPDIYSNLNVMRTLEISLFWKVFADTKYTFDDYKIYEMLKGKNVILSGYAKMDNYFIYLDKKNTNLRKKIIIAPHHSVTYDLLPLSNFLKYSDFFLSLPDRYPDVDFIFRPHPLLFTTLVNNKLWTQQQVDNYLEAMKQKGVVYSYGGDYFSIFAESDAIIHDCSSYIVEYLFTNKPCCFMAKKDNNKYLNRLGKSSLRFYRKAFSENEICLFIDDVLSNKIECSKSQYKFLKNKIAINYPNVSKFILHYIGNSING